MQDVSKEFDVFICYSHKDKEEVHTIARQLRDQQLKVWLDEWVVRPGEVWQHTLEKQIKHIKVATVFFGPHEIRGWRRLEEDAFLREFAQREYLAIIPVILKSAPPELELPLFLQGFHLVDFRKQRPDPLYQMLWGIRESQSPIYPEPRPQPEHIRTTYQPGFGNKGTIIFTLNGTEYTLEYTRQEKLFSPQVFLLTHRREELIRITAPFATVKPFQKQVPFQIDGVQCLFLLKISAVTSSISVRVKIGEQEVTF